MEHLEHSMDVPLRHQRHAKVRHEVLALEQLAQSDSWLCSEVRLVDQRPLEDRSAGKSLVHALAGSDDARVPEPVSCNTL